MLFAILKDLYASGIRPPITQALDGAWRAVSQMQRDYCPSVPEQVVAIGIESWARLHGAISFEMFGQFNHMVSDPAALYWFIIDEELTRLGLAAGPVGSG